MDLTPKTLSDIAGISQSHASMILSGKRAPSLQKALLIYTKTGQKFGILDTLDEDMIDRLRLKVAA